MNRPKEEVLGVDVLFVQVRPGHHFRLDQQRVVKVATRGVKGDDAGKLDQGTDVVQLAFKAEPHGPVAKGTFHSVGDVADDLVFQKC